MNAALDLRNSDQFDYYHHPLPVNQDCHDFIKTLVNANGCSQKIASGSYGSVYQIGDSDKVLKICQSPSLDRDGYHTFLEMVVTMKNNRFFPKVENFIRYKTNQPVIVYGVVMERLVEMRDASIQQLTAIAHDSFINFKMPEPWGVQVTDTQSLTSWEIIHQIVTYLREAIRTDKIDTVINNLELREACKSISRLLQKNRGFCNDLGSSNIMLRPVDDEFELVITDPIA
jgi:hypothetical protein